MMGRWAGESKTIGEQKDGKVFSCEGASVSELYVHIIGFEGQYILPYIHYERKPPANIIQEHSKL